MNLEPPIQVTRVYQVPILTVWEMVTRQENLAKWLMPGNFKPEVGFQYFFQAKPQGDEWDGKIFGEVLEVDKPNHIKFTWNTTRLNKKTVVTFKLEETTDGVLFKIEHGGFSQIDHLEYQKHTKGWTHHLTSIENLTHNGKK